MFQGKLIDLLILSNLDEDHVKDLPYMRHNVRLGSIFSNPTLTANTLAAMKREHGMGNGVREVHAILQHYGTGLIGRPADLGSVRAWAYWNRYGLDFTDTNNLSLAIFIRYGTFTILFAGDLEAVGWRALMHIPGFLGDLLSVNVFVTSHHGRKNGCCDEVFWVCRPDVFVISDHEHQFDSQDTTNWYRRRAYGIYDLDAVPDFFFGYPRRYVLTTRHEGTLLIRVAPNECFHIQSQRQPLLRPAISAGQFSKF